MTGNANSVKVIDLNKKWQNLKEKGDITDVFEMANNDEEVLKKLEELEKETSGYIKKPEKVKVDIQKEFEVKELDLKLKMPKNYKVSLENGIITTKIIKKIKIEVPICPIPILISKVLKNIDTLEEKVELIFYKRNKWEKLIVDKNTIYSSQNILTLANKGIPVSSKNNLDLVKWLYELEASNINELKVERNINRYGWINDKTFIPYRCNDVHIELEAGINTWLDKIGEKRGTIEEWTTNIKEFIEQDDTGIIRFMLAVGFSSCLLHIVNYRGTIYHLWR